VFKILYEIRSSCDTIQTYLNLTRIDMTRHILTMPIEIQPNDSHPIDVRPETNEANVLAILAKHPNKAFTQAELADRADVSRTSIYKTVDRLLTKGLAQRYTDGDHIHITHERRDAIYRRLRSFRDAQTFEQLFDGDYFSENPNWADEFDDLGREPLPEQETDASETADTNDDFEVADLPDLDADEES
jgi:DNA-binding MarR family transcriptional regulator